MVIVVLVAHLQVHAELIQSPAVRPAVCRQCPLVALAAHRVAMDAPVESWTIFEAESTVKEKNVSRP
jgi:hypothetical protein